MYNLLKEEKTGSILITTNRTILDYYFIYSFLTRSYRAKGISK